METLHHTSHVVNNRMLPLAQTTKQMTVVVGSWSCVFLNDTLSRERTYSRDFNCVYLIKTQQL